ncbi:hypothetical protein GOBAR_AA37680 [Gossypium barbadense]|uniref:DUF7725 domain-containing protein n=1 Tax=Gossypium barbadense TaxID=3634 RepID=A0A2P5VW45_GOSBA|nr:hypothetical protein GOBAR_AA37680 [Gossypium barbadense]
MSAVGRRLDIAKQHATDVTETLNAETNILISAKTSGTVLLDERPLLACIVRTIPTGGRIQISSTAPISFGKVLPPLHWLDHKKWYRKLDDFVASFPKLSVIGGDYIQPQEGLQEMIAARCYC